MDGYEGTLPRDLFNESGLTKCVGRLWIGLDDERGHRAAFVSETLPSFEIEQDDADGSISIANLDFRVDGRPVRLWRPLNARGPWPLWARFRDDDSMDDVAVLDDEGALTGEMRVFVGHAPHDPRARILALAHRAIAANRIVAATNVGGLEDADGAFERIHDAANDLTISTQLELAIALGWVDPRGVPSTGASALGLSMLDEITHGGASNAQLADAAGLPADAPERIG